MNVNNMLNESEADSEHTQETNSFFHDFSYTASNVFDGFEERSHDKHCSSSDDEDVSGAVFPESYAMTRDEQGMQRADNDLGVPAHKEGKLQYLKSFLYIDAFLDVVSIFRINKHVNCVSFCS